MCFNIYCERQKISLFHIVLSIDFLKFSLSEPQKMKTNNPLNSRFYVKANNQGFTLLKWQSLALKKSFFYQKAAITKSSETGTIFDIFQPIYGLSINLRGMYILREKKTFFASPSWEQQNWERPLQKCSELLTIQKAAQPETLVKNLPSTLKTNQHIENLQFRYEGFIPLSSSSYTRNELKWKKGWI